MGFPSVVTNPQLPLDLPILKSPDGRHHIPHRPLQRLDLLLHREEDGGKRQLLLLPLPIALSDGLPPNPLRLLQTPLYGVDLRPQGHLHTLDVVIGRTGILHSSQSLLHSLQDVLGFGHLVQNHRPDGGGVLHSNHQRRIVILPLLPDSIKTSPDQSIGVGVDLEPTKLTTSNPRSGVGEILAVKVLEVFKRTHSGRTSVDLLLRRVTIGMLSRGRV
jgi:hypothetical protein